MLPVKSGPRRPARPRRFVADNVLPNLVEFLEGLGFEFILSADQRHLEFAAPSRCAGLYDRVRGIGHQIAHWLLTRFEPARFAGGPLDGKWHFAAAREEILFRTSDENWLVYVTDETFAARFVGEVASRSSAKHVAQLALAPGSRLASKG